MGGRAGGERERALEPRLGRQVERLKVMLPESVCFKSGTEASVWFKWGLGKREWRTET